MSTSTKTRIVGAPVFRKEGVDKLLGRARYLDDLEFEGMWHGATVRSTIPRGDIRALYFGPRIDWKEFAVVTAFDIPGKNNIRLIFDDQPCLADGRVNHCEEAIVLLAHPDRQKVREAIAAVHIEYDPLPAVFTIEESELQDVIVWGQDGTGAVIRSGSVVYAGTRIGSETAVGHHTLLRSFVIVGDRGPARPQPHSRAGNPDRQ